MPRRLAACRRGPGHAGSTRTRGRRHGARQVARRRDGRADPLCDGIGAYEELHQCGRVENDHPRASRISSSAAVTSSAVTADRAAMVRAASAASSGQLALLAVRFQRCGEFPLHRASIPGEAGTPMVDVIICGSSDASVGVTSGEPIACLVAHSASFTSSFPVVARRPGCRAYCGTVSGHVTRDAVGLWRSRRPVRPSRRGRDPKARYVTPATTHAGGGDRLAAGLSQAPSHALGRSRSRTLARDIGALARELIARESSLSRFEERCRVPRREPHHRSAAPQRQPSSRATVARGQAASGRRTPAPAGKHSW